MSKPNVFRNISKQGTGHMETNQNNNRNQALSVNYYSLFQIMMRTEAFTFWHLFNKKWEETCVWIDPTRTIEEMKCDCFTSAWN